MIEAWIAQQLIKGLLRSLLLTEVLELLAAACFPQRNRHDFLLVILSGRCLFAIFFVIMIGGN